MADLSDLLSSYQEPNLGQTLAEARAIVSVERQGAGVKVVLEFGFPTGGYADEIAAALRAHLAAAGADQPVAVELRSKITAHAVQRGLAPLTIGLMLAGTWVLAKTVILGPSTAVIAGVVTAILLARHVNPALLIFGGGIVGYLLGR